MTKLKYTWFQLMWKNFYIQLFIVAIVFLSAILVHEFFIEPFSTLGGLLLTLSLPVGMIILIAYKGFYQFWDDYKKGKTR